MTTFVFNLLLTHLKIPLALVSNSSSLDILPSFIALATVLSSISLKVLMNSFSLSDFSGFSLAYFIDVLC